MERPTAVQTTQGFADAPEAERLVKRTVASPALIAARILKGEGVSPADIRRLAQAYLDGVQP